MAKHRVSGEHRDYPQYPQFPHLQSPVEFDLVGAAQYMTITPRHMRRLVAERRVTFLKVGRLLRFRRSDLDQYLADHQVAACEEGE